ncbi:kinase-like domain-containing protein [Mycena maculata]|uniref:Kinase-like domain-containing protein n=1 Tax=Mycena maculata TaxID=230809 RepID=A0AAD7KFY4_9AGAR|nr:kinase-like domain-containing protein [Mycena maculata]
MGDLPAPGKYRYLLEGEQEQFWHDHFNWLKECGYLLRPRYHPDWVPTWIKDPKKKAMRCEDYQMSESHKVIDATRISDGSFVTLKPLDTTVHPDEIPIGVWFSQEPQASSPSNHCVPILDVLDIPDIPNKRIIVMPFLSSYDKPRFDTFGEAIEFFRQIFQGLQYMHKNNVAHRDCNALNIMMDAKPLYPVPYHPTQQKRRRDWKGLLPVSYLTRTQKPVKYYLIDFGLSRKYPPGVRAPLEPIILGGDKSVPEFRAKPGEELPLECDPFPTDVYYIGNVLRTDFVEGSQFVKRKLGFEFLRPLMADMIQPDPALRPTMDEVVERFDAIVRGLSRRKLRSRVAKVDDSLDYIYAVRHWFRKIGLIVRRYPPIPSPSH